MGKNKLAQFAENKTFSHMFEPHMEEVKSNAFKLKGNWNKTFFKNENPLVIELGCGKGEYTVNQAKNNPHKNYIGIDIKGARMWRGAKTVQEEQIANVAFLRTRIEFIASFFAENEVDEIWLTFSDPQPKKPNKRLISPYYIAIYKKILSGKGSIHIKTDSRLFVNTALQQIKEHQFTIHHCAFDIYGRDWANFSKEEQEVLAIKTYYETMWLKKQFPINYLSFSLH